MWNKNGNATVTRQAYIYRCSPLCANRMFSTDILLLQTICAITGPDKLVNLMLGTFEGLSNSPMMKMIVNFKNFEDKVGTPLAVDDYKRDLVLAEGFLVLLLWVATERLGCGLSRRDNIRRAAVHALLRRPLSHSGLCEVLPCTGDDVDEHLKSILSEIADYTDPSPDQPGKYHIKDDMFMEYEPYYPHYIQGDRQDTYEHFERFASTQRRSEKNYRFLLPVTPLVQTHIRPIVDTLSPVWKLVVCDTTLTYIYILLHNAAMSPPSSVLPKADSVIAVALHLLLLAVRVSRSSMKVHLGDNEASFSKTKKSSIVDDDEALIFDCNNDVFSFAVTPVTYKTKQVSFMKRLFSSNSNAEVSITCIELLVRLMMQRPDEAWVKMTCTCILQELCFGSPVCLNCLRSVLKYKVNASDVISLRSVLTVAHTASPSSPEDETKYTSSTGLLSSKYVGDFADQGKGHAKYSVMRKTIGNNGNVAYGDIEMDSDPVLANFEHELGDTTSPSSSSPPLVIEPTSETLPVPTDKKGGWKAKQEELMKQFQARQAKFLEENHDYDKNDDMTMVLEGDGDGDGTPHLGTTPRVNLSTTTKYGTPFTMTPMDDVDDEPLEKPVCVFCHGDNQDVPIGHLVHVVKSKMTADVKRPDGDVDAFVKSYPRCKQTDLYDDELKQKLCGTIEPVRYDGLPGDGCVSIDTAPGPKGWNGVLTLRKLMYERGDECTGACVSGCGHWMHVTCMQRYLNTLIIKYVMHLYEIIDYFRSYEGTTQFEGRRYLRIVHCHEFLCPLCKCLCNSIIPSISNYLPLLKDIGGDGDDEMGFACDDDYASGPRSEIEIIDNELKYCLNTLADKGNV